MQDEKALQLFNKILSKTRSRALDWEQTAEDGKYIATLGKDLVLTLWPFTTIRDAEPIGPPSVSLGDSEKSVLLDMTHQVDGISVDELEELSALAKRIALKIDKTVDAALKRLDELPDEEDIPF